MHGIKQAAAAVLLAAAVAVAAGATAVSSGAAGGTVTGSKAVTPGDIGCNGSAQVTLTLVGQNGIAGTPQDIELVLDRSGSMGGTPIADLKTAANQFVDTIDEATDGVLDGTIANGSRIGIVSFATTATVDVPLTGSAAPLHAAINALVASGNTNHQAAISTGQSELAGSLPANGKTMIIFTDGETTVGTNAQAEAAAARSAGTVIYSIGLGSVNVAQLDGWATDPDSAHVFVAPTSADLDQIFQQIGAAIIVPAASQITVVDTVASHFTPSGAVASKGAVTTAANVLTWTLDKLGTETATMTYTIAHDPAQPGGVEATNVSVAYADAEGHTVAFGSPTVNVRGCAKAIALTPPTATNDLTVDQSHAVTATVTDDFGDPVGSVPVSFSITAGPNAGTTGSGTTAADGTTPFAYTAHTGASGLGTDTIQGCFTNGGGASVCATAQKLWADLTPPTVACDQGTNASGKKVPPAGNQNPDGFYLLTAHDGIDTAPQVFVADTASPFVAGGFPSGTNIKLVQAPDATPSSTPGPNQIDWSIKLKGDAAVYAVDASGNTSAPISCKVPPPPK